MPATPRGTSPFVRFAAIAAALTLSVSSGAQAQSVHNSYGKYSVMFDAQNTAFNSVHLLNGYENELCCFGRNQTTNAPDDHLLLKFVADPGYAFTTMSMGFTQFYLSTNAVYGFIEYHGDWNVSTGTFAPGSESWRYDFINDHIGWDQSGTGGTFFRQDYFWGSGGVHTWIPIMSSAGISFANAPEFMLDMNIGGAANGVYGTYLDVYAETVVAPVTAAPEPQTYSMLVAGLGLIGFARRRSRRVK
jgi:hypothetical protein